MLKLSPFDVSGDPNVQTAPVPHLASVGGNAGQLSYSYPISVAPGVGGFAPQLSLSYSSQSTNERYSRRSPAGSVGEGWSLGLGSISAETYPSSSSSAGTWYFLSGVGNVSDRLVPDTSNFYQTEHISRLRIQMSNNCFHIWDRYGYYYDLGCTSNSLQYYSDSTGTKHYYRWDVDKILAPYESTSQVKTMFISYLQDTTTSGGYTTIRDAALKQISYGYATSTSASSLTLTAGTVDFHYHAPTAVSGWVTAYGTNYNCSGSPPSSTTWRCDDPQVYGNIAAPPVMSTFTLDSVSSFVGTDSSSSNTAYKYTFTYHDDPFTTNYYDSYSLVQETAAGNHLLTAVTPIVYQNGTAHTLKGLTMSYSSPLQDVYYDSAHTTSNPSQQYGGQTFWEYLTKYQDLNTGVGGSINYATAYSNTHGTPYVTNGGGTIIDDRHDPLYCTLHANDSDGSKHCTGNYLHPEDHAWSVQVVTQTQALGTDSSSSSLTKATTTYNYYLASYGTYSGSGTYCYPAGTSPYLSGQTDCVYDSWIPGYDNSGNPLQDGDWQDYYHSEFHGFYGVYITSPAGDLTTDYYASTEAWYTPNSNSGNYNSGQLYEEDIYKGNQVSDSALLRKTVNTHTGGTGYYNSCKSSSYFTYNPCEVMVVSSKTTLYEGTGSSNSNAPWVETDNTYDDYNSSSGLGSGYHNLTQQVISSSNAPTLTKKWSYQTNDQTVNNVTYYHVDTPTHSEIDDSSGHVWQCQDLTYDEGVVSGVPAPAAGWVTTTKAYSNCANQSSTTLTSYAGYDVYGNTVEAVDPYAVANSSMYSSNGCTLSTSPAYHSSSWSASHYTQCTTYDSYAAQPSSTSNAFSQSSSVSYDYTQDALPTSSTDANSQVTSTAYSYDSSGNSTVQVSQPTEGGSYTSQSKTNSSCTSTSTLPCYEIDSNTSQYSSAIARTFYDSLGREVETRTPGPDSTHDTIVFTIYDDAHHSTFQSVPFRVTSGSSWVDPNGATDDSGATPGGTTTYLDALGRVVGVQDPSWDQVESRASVVLD